MPANIDVAFVRQYEDEVKEAYQRHGSLLRNMVRTKRVSGKSTTFQKVGTGVAADKSRGGLVPVMNLDHSNVECILKDKYAGEYLDDLDELKINHDERGVIVRAASHALGRATDDQILAALDTTTATDIAAHGTLLNRKWALTGVEYLNDNNVPDDGERFCILSPRQWSAMMQITEFTDSDYVGDKYPFLKGREHRNWMNVTWVHHSGIQRKGTNTVDCFLFHRSAIGHAVGTDIMTDISWENTRSSHFFNSRMSMQAILIDTVGCVRIAVDDTVALT